MPRFTVLCRRDAYVDYTARVDADTAEDAAWIANEQFEEQSWVRRDVSEFDACLFVTLDEEGAEIEGTECGKLA
ncbi:MAG TPA: hypothetical protein VL358_15740 [Caulobacteraceae bacterium]|jgi:hypothetical protein|nr:hypothetical protein [Caulobacteraceae bacterium]